MLRAFIAVDVSAISAIAKLQDEIASAAGWSAKEVKPVEQQNFHFTIIFLGEISESDAARVQLKLASVHFDPIEVSYVGVGAFPSSNSARVVWVGVDTAGAKKLAEIAGKIISAMSELGFISDKPFSPHLTIFRAKSRQLSVGTFAQKYEGMVIGTDRFERIHLKKSELTPAGPIYSNVYTVEAGK